MEIKQYEVYYSINIRNYPNRDDIPNRGKILIKKAEDEFDAKEKGIERLVDGLDINSKDITIRDVIFWDSYYE